MDRFNCKLAKHRHIVANFFLIKQDSIFQFNLLRNDNFAGLRFILTYSLIMKILDTIRNNFEMLLESFMPS